MDKNEQLIELSQRRQFWEMDLDRLSIEERVVRAIFDLERDVNNGGFDQYYFNSSGDTAFLVVEALETIGASAAAQIARKANRLFPNATPPRDRDERIAIVSSFGWFAKRKLDRLDEQFYRYPDNLTELLHAYVLANAGEISGANECITPIDDSGD